MIYSNLEFLFFLVFTFFLFSCVQNPRFRFWVLLVSSLFFYAWSGTIDTIIFLAVILVSWAAIALARRFPNGKNSLVNGAIILMLIHLCVWKYSAWAVSQLQILWPTLNSGKPFVLPLPAGISFFTLQGIAYLVDYKRGTAGYMLLKEFILFKSFFPQLIAGPIVRYHDLLPQIRKMSGPSIRDIQYGLFLFSIGLFKKLAVADHMGDFVDEVFSSPKTFSRSSLLLALCGYSVQIWADFSGYTDMGRGAARIFGFRLPENFRSPYLATSPSEFWKRWHITLSEWIRDYVYLPMGGSRGSKLRSFSVVVLTMGISGFWHGAGWCYLLWGIYHGLLLILERVYVKSALGVWAKQKLNPYAYFSFSFPLMLMLTGVGWMIFRSPTPTIVYEFASGLIFPTMETLKTANLNYVYPAVLFCLVFQVVTYSHLESKDGSHNALMDWLSSQIEKSPVLVRSAFLGLTTACIFLLATLLRPLSTSINFIYFQF